MKPNKEYLEYFPAILYLIFAVFVLLIMSFASFKESETKQENMIKCIEAGKSEEFCSNVFG
jgi:hypothetical protein